MQINPKRFESFVAMPLLLLYLELKDKPRSIALVERMFPATRYGLQIIGKRWREMALLSIAQEIDKVIGDLRLPLGN